MNIYRHRFSAPCSENAIPVDYLLEIRTTRAVRVERLMAACEDASDGAEKPYHENIADTLFSEFGGYHKLIAFHHGVEIETIRGRL